MSGFWHGANWTFIIWGGIHALFFTLFLVLKNAQLIGNSKTSIVTEGSWLPSIKELIQMLFTFSVVMLGWVFFRAETLSQAVSYCATIFSDTLFSRPEIIPTVLLLLLSFFILIEWFGRNDEFAIEKLGASWKRPIRWVFYSYLIFLIGMFMQTDETPFIYFQF